MQLGYGNGRVPGSTRRRAEQAGYDPASVSCVAPYFAAKIRGSSPPLGRSGFRAVGLNLQPTTYGVLQIQSCVPYSRQWEFGE
jgi:hypothetical protein